jgi:hypothetical protein
VADDLIQPGLAKSNLGVNLSPMLVIRRMDDGRHSYTAIFLPGEQPRVFPTSDREHARILQVFKQDRPYQDVLNDFTDFMIGDSFLPTAPGIGHSEERPARSSIASSG